MLTFFSPSGYTGKKDYAGADHIFYLPLDSPGNARQFIDLVKPTLVLWVKYDYWYYFLVELKKRNIPVLLVSGVFRADQPFFDGMAGCTGICWSVSRIFCADGGFEAFAGEAAADGECECQRGYAVRPGDRDCGGGSCRCR